MPKLSFHQFKFEIMQEIGRRTLEVNLPDPVLREYYIRGISPDEVADDFSYAENEEAQDEPLE